MPNLFTPERGADESYKDYVVRRKVAKATAKAIRNPQATAPFVQRKAEPARSKRRHLVGALGLRQFKALQRMKAWDLGA